MGKLVCGVGFNDADYEVRISQDGKSRICPYYQCWAGMLRRCYSEKYQKRKPSYLGCRVSDDWLIFSNFKAWMELQDWHGKQLDKDLLSVGNKIYTSELCAFVDAKTNSFITDSAATRGKFLIGVHEFVGRNKFIATCKNPFTNKHEHLGVHWLEKDAHEAWRKRKHELACKLADIQTDNRVAAALRIRYANPL